MTIFARNPDTGQARWAYQMTPHDEWDYDGVNEMILATLNINGKPTKALVHFDRNGFGYTLDRTTGKVLVAQHYGPGVNWASKVDLATGVPVRNPKFGTTSKENTTGICPAAIGYKDQQPAAFSPKTGLFYVPTNNICMDYEGVEVKYAVGQPYVGAIVRMFPGPGGNRGVARRIRRRAHHPERPGLLRNHGRLAEGGRRDLGQGALAVQDSVRDHRQPDDVPRT